MNRQQIVIWLTAAFFVLYGLAFSLFPVEMSLLVTGSQPETISGKVDFRATYGGVTLAVGVILFYLHYLKHDRLGLVLVVFVLSSMAVTRAIGFWLDGMGNGLMMAYLVLEIVTAALAWFLLAHTPDKGQ